MERRIVENLRRELEGKEMELLDLDNTVIMLTKTNSSLYDNIYDAIYYCNYTYATGDMEGITIAFKILDELNLENEDEIDIRKINVKVENIEEF